MKTALESEQLRYKYAFSENYKSIDKLVQDRKQKNPFPKNSKIPIENFKSSKNPYRNFKNSKIPIEIFPKNFLVGFRISFREDELRKEMDEMKVLGKRKTPARINMSHLTSSKRGKRRREVKGEIEVIKI